MDVHTLVSHYLITGVDLRGRRFRVKRYSEAQAHDVPFASGSVWRVDPTGRRHLERRVRAERLPAEVETDVNPAPFYGLRGDG